MMRRPVRLAIYAMTVLTTIGVGTMTAMAGTTPSTKAAATLVATFHKDSDWGTGYQATYTIRNTGSTAVNGWQVAFTLPTTATLGTFWDATVTTSGGVSTARNKGYNASIAAGGSTAFGFVVAGSGDPTTCAVNGAACAAGGPPPVTTPPTRASTNPTTAPTTSPTTGRPTATTTSPPPPPPTGAATRVAPYVDMGLLANGATTLAQLGRAGGVTSFSLAFVTSVGCRASWFNAFDPRTRPFADQIAAVRAAGGDVRVSFGGATGIELAQACTDVRALQAEYQAVVSAYGLKYIDLDIEGAAVADPATIARRSTALAALQKANPGLKISLTLPVLPEGLTGDGLNVVRSARNAGVDLDLVNVMAMDYGRAGQDYGDLAIRAAKSTKDQIRSVYGIGDAAAFRMLGVTPMLGRNDDQGTFNQSDARDLVAFANANRLGLVSFWEANRDRNACTGALFQCTNVPQTPFEFSRIFATFTA